MPLKIALTGATGFIGRHVVDRLQEEKHSVAVLARDVARADFPKNVVVVQGDLQNEQALQSLTQNADVCIHIAGLISAVRKQDYVTANEQGTRRLVNVAVESGVKRFVHVSSMSAREPQLSAYGASKLAGERIVEEFADRLSSVILRPPAVYGPGDKATLPLLKSLTHAVAVLPSRATARFSLLHVHDLARIIVEAASSTRSGIVELGDGAPRGHDWRELAGVVAHLENRNITPMFLPKFIPFGIAMVAETLAKVKGQASMISRDKINELYHSDWVERGEGWPLKGPTSLAQGLAETLAWYRREGWISPGTKSRTAT